MHRGDPMFGRCLRSVKPPYPGGGYGGDGKGAGSGDVAAPAWQGRSIAGPKLRLVEFSAFHEQQPDPEAVSFNQHTHTETYTHTHNTYKKLLTRAQITRTRARTLAQKRALTLLRQNVALRS